MRKSHNFVDYFTAELKVGDLVVYAYRAGGKYGRAYIGVGKISKLYPPTSTKGYKCRIDGSIVKTSAVLRIDNLAVQHDLLLEQASLLEQAKEKEE